MHFVKNQIFRALEHQKQYKTDSKQTDTKMASKNAQNTKNGQYEAVALPLELHRHLKRHT